MVLGKLSVPGRPTNLDNSRTRAYCAYSRYEFFFLTFFSLVYSCYRIYSIVSYKNACRNILLILRLYIQFFDALLLYDTCMPLIWIKEGQGPTVIAVDAGWGCLDSFSLVFSCYHVYYSKVSYKNACRNIDSDLTSHSTILDSISRRFVVV